MDEEAITWNLKGPKRMKKRRELNALIKNNLKYNPFSKYTGNNSTNDFKLADRLLKNQNDSSNEENEDYYFSANKFVLRNRTRRNYCKLFKFIVFGFIATFAILACLTLFFSYSKFNDSLKDVKSQIQIQSEQNLKEIDNLKRHYDDHDELVKSINSLESRISKLEKSNLKSISNERGERDQSKLPRLKRRVDRAFNS